MIENQKLLSFYQDNVLLGPPKKLELSDKEIELMCPFIDLCHKNDKVSIKDITESEVEKMIKK